VRVPPPHTPLVLVTLVLLLVLVVTPWLALAWWGSPDFLVTPCTAERKGQVTDGKMRVN
jgi:hypothetical protein